MIDIHCHILPGVDDGSADLETSVIMAETAVDSGTTDIIATPHTNQAGRFENYYSPELDALYGQIAEEIRKRDIPLRIHRGMEVYGSGMVPQMYREGKLISLAGSRYFLIEFGFHDEPEHMDRILKDLQKESLVPILAHPERYIRIQEHPNWIYRWVNEGILMQSNKGSFTGYFGRRPRQLAFAMAARGLTSFIASDAHGYGSRSPSMDEVEEIITIEFSGDMAERLITVNPGRVLKDEEIRIGHVYPFQ